MAKFYGRLFKSNYGLAHQVNGAYQWLIRNKRKAIKLWEKGIRLLRECTEDKYRLRLVLLEETFFLLHNNHNDKKARGYLIEARDLFEQYGSKLTWRKPIN
jgi:hypothetical protein